MRNDVPEPTEQLLRGPRRVLRFATVVATIVALAAPSLLVACSSEGGDSAESAPANGFEDASGLRLVMLVSIDTLRPDHLSLYGYERETSPYLQELASESTVFRRAYSHVPFTLIAHASLFSSMFPDTHGVTRKTNMPSSVPLLAEELAEEGFDTYGYYASDWLDPRFGYSRGFDEWHFNYHGWETQEQALETLDEIAVNGTPAFLFLHYFDVHCGPLKQPGPLYPSHPDYRDTFLPHDDVDASRYSPEDIYHDRVELTEREKENVVAQYDGGILYVDTLLRQLTDKMKDLEIYDEALIIVTSDHGESLGHEDTFDSHGSFWEEGLRVPLLVKLPVSDPERPRWVGQEIEERVQLIDVAPTILRVAGVRKPDLFQGHDLFDEIEQEVLATRSNVGVLYTGDYKLVLIKKKMGRRTKLFDLRLDPGEETPIRDRDEFAEELADRLWDQRIKYKRMRKALGGGKLVELDDKMRQRLIELGYLEVAEDAKAAAADGEAAVAEEDAREGVDPKPSGTMGAGTRQ